MHDGPLNMYTLQALILDFDNVIQAKRLNLKLVPLTHGLFLVPLRSSFLKEHSLPFLPLIDGEIDSFYGALEKICITFSETGKAAYVEAEFFGGSGTQGYALYESGRVVHPPIVDPAAINSALNWLGVNAKDPQDEFSAVGLNLHRDTDEW